MSDLAEYARIYHESNDAGLSVECTPIDYPSQCDHLSDVRAVICDVYGTLVHYWRDGFADTAQKELLLLQAFRTVITAFGMEAALTRINPSVSPEKTVYDFYNGLITLQHDQAKGKGVALPEIAIEKIWEIIITILKRNGYEIPLDGSVSVREFSRKVAWTYNFHALGRELYPGVVDALSGLKNKNMVLGLLSNAQFYTPIDLTLMVRDQSNNTFDDIFELFDDELSFLSYEYLVAKPDQLLFRKLYDALYEYQILPSQTVFVGNDLVTDIEPAQRIGMKTAFFTGDSNSTFMGELRGTVIPDITFTSWEDLADRLSFHSEENA